MLSRLLERAGLGRKVETKPLDPALELVQQNMQRLLEADSPEALMELIQLAEHYHDIDPTGDKALASESMRNTWDSVSERLLTSALADTEVGAAAKDVFLKLALRTNEAGESVADTALAYAETQVHTSGIKKWRKLFNGNELAVVDKRVEGYRAILETVLANYTSVGKELLSAWTDSATYNRFTKKDLNSPEQRPNTQWQAMRHLEQAQPGSVDRLVKERGIMNFVRYPEALLLQQLDPPESPTQPYGLVITARADHNGSFFNAYNAFEHVQQDTADTHRLRIIEASTKIELAKRLLQIEQETGGQQRADFAIVSAHGDKESMVLGRMHQGAAAQLEKADLPNALGLQRGRERFLAEDATIVLASCSTGRRDGIGQALTEYIGVNTIGPKADNVTTEDIRVHRNANGKLDFKVKYKSEGWFGVRVGKYNASPRT